jgi:hypothetical protein
MIIDPKSDPVTLYAMLEGLSVVGYDRAFEELVSHVAQVKGKLRRMLLHAIIRIGERCTRCVKDADGIREHLIDALSDDNAAIKISAAKGLANLDGDDVTGAMVQELGKNPDVDAILIPLLEYRPGVFVLIVAALEAAEMTPSKEVIGLMGRLVSHIQYSTIPKEFLDRGNTLLASAVSLVEGAWVEADEETRATIVDTLFRLDGDQAIRALDTIRNDPDPWLRMRVIELLMPLEDRRIPEFISRFLQDDDEMVREVATSSLESKGMTFGVAEAH